MAQPSEPRRPPALPRSTHRVAPPPLPSSLAVDLTPEDVRSLPPAAVARPAPDAAAVDAAVRALAAALDDVRRLETGLARRQEEAERLALAIEARAARPSRAPASVARPPNAPALLLAFAAALCAAVATGAWVGTLGHPPAADVRGR